MDGIHSPLVAGIRLFVFLLWTFLAIPVYATLLGLQQIHLCRRLALVYWRVVAWLMGMEVVLRGQIATEKPILFVANHASYLDIIVLGGLVLIGDVLLLMQMSKDVFG